MKTFRLLFTLAALLTTTLLAAQTPTSVKPDTVCMGATGEEYFVHKTTGSTYSWSLSGGGTIATTDDTLITVNWDNTLGIDSVYIVETNTHGCVGDTVKLAVVRVAPPVADAGADQNIGACNTTTIGPATVDPNYTYSWSPSAGLNDPNIANPTVSLAGGSTQTYTLTVTSQHGCTSTDDVTITVNPVVIADAGANDTIGGCVGQSTTLDASASSGAGISYSWSPAASLSNANIANPVASPSATTTYTVTVTDDEGCTATATVEVFVESAPVADAGADVSIGDCPGQSTTLDASASTGKNITYSWSPAASLSDATIANPVASPAATTTYTLTITDEFGCTSTDQVTVTVDPAPVADAGTDEDICAGGSTTLDASASTGTSLSYSWSPAAGLSATNVANPTASPATTTTYTLEVTDAYGCTSTSTVTITVIPNATADAGADDDVCEGNDYTLSGSANNQVSVLWTTSGDGTFSDATLLNPVYTPGPNDIANGTVTLQLQANSGGSCPADTDSMILIIRPKPTTSPIFHY